MCFCSKKTLQEDRVVGGQHGVDEMTWKIEEVGDGYQVCCFPVCRFCTKRRNCWYVDLCVKVCFPGTDLVWTAVQSPARGGIVYEVACCVFWSRSASGGTQMMPTDLFTAEHECCWAEVQIRCYLCIRIREYGDTPCTCTACVVMINEISVLWYTWEWVLVWALDVVKLLVLISGVDSKCIAFFRMPCRQMPQADSCSAWGECC